MGVLIDSGALSERSIVIATYALCGYANPGSIGVQLAVLGKIVFALPGNFAPISQPFFAFYCIHKFTKKIFCLERELKPVVFDFFIS